MLLVLFNPIDRALLSAITQGQNGPGSNSNEEVLLIPQSSSIIGTSQSDCLVSYAGQSWGSLPLCRGAVNVFYRPNRLGKVYLGNTHFKMDDYILLDIFNLIS